MRRFVRRGRFRRYRGTLDQRTLDQPVVAVGTRGVRGVRGGVVGLEFLGRKGLRGALHS